MQRSRSAWSRMRLHSVDAHSRALVSRWATVQAQRTSAAKARARGLMPPMLLDALGVFLLCAHETGPEALRLDPVQAIGEHGEVRVPPARDVEHGIAAGEAAMREDEVHVL